jgi:hypothetical protein
VARCQQVASVWLWLLHCQQVASVWLWLLHCQQVASALCCRRCMFKHRHLVNAAVWQIRLHAAGVHITKLLPAACMHLAMHDSKALEEDPE